MLRQLIPLTLAAALLAPLAASAQTPAPTPAAPATPTAPVTPTAPADPAAPTARHANRVNGKITAVDATAKTVTISRRKTTVTLSVPDGVKIYKIGDTRRNPTGTFADLTVDANITARTNGDADKPVATEVHLRAPRNAATPVTPAAPATPTAPATPPAPPAPPAAP